MSEHHKGVLIIGHGSRNNKWVDLLDEVVHNIKTTIPITVGYLELVEGRSISDGVRELEGKGVQQIFAIPFFVCSGSTHLDEIQYLLGVIDEPSIDTDLRPMALQAETEIVWCPAMDAHPYVIQLLAERIQALSNEPANESLFLVVHGSDKPYFKGVWEETINELLLKLNQQFPFFSVDYGTILPDTIEQRAIDLHSDQKRMIVIPVFLSEGYYTTKIIPNKLKNIPHIYDGKTYLPHDLIQQWLQDQVNRI